MRALDNAPMHCQDARVCVNPGSEANHGILRGYLIDIGKKGVELAQRVEG